MKSWIALVSCLALGVFISASASALTVEDFADGVFGPDDTVNWTGINSGLTFLEDNSGTPTFERSGDHPGTNNYCHGAEYNTQLDLEYGQVNAEIRYRGEDNLIPPGSTDPYWFAAIIMSPTSGDTFSTSCTLASGDGFGVYFYQGAWSFAYNYPGNSDPDNSHWMVTGWSNQFQNENDGNFWELGLQITPTATPGVYDYNVLKNGSIIGPTAQLWWMGGGTPPPVSVYAISGGWYVPPVGTFTDIDYISVHQVPEPSILLLVGSGIVAFLARRRV
jgi:hypothetical protein